MSPEKKVLSLLFALIVLMAICVYTHLPKFTEKQNSSNNKQIEDIKNTQEKPLEKVVKEEKPKPLENEQAIIEEKIEEKVQEDPKENQEILKENQEISNETVDTEVQKEEKFEPLVITDKRYTRVGDEKNIEDLSKTTQELQLKMIELVKENPIIFKKDGFKVTGRSDKTVRKIAESLKEFPNIKIEVAGHTDASGAEDLNMWFSKERAKGVRARLISLGIEKERIKARGYGESIPLEGINKYSKQNRRVEFNIVEE